MRWFSAVDCNFQSVCQNYIEIALEKTEMSDLDIVNINVGGTLFSTRFSTLKSLPDTRLGKLSTSSEEYTKEKGYFFFDRNPDLFHCLLDLYRHGNLHVPSSICGATLKRELEFWEIPLCTIPHCCLAIICKYEEAIDSMKSLKSHFASEEGIYFCRYYLIYCNKHIII